jgi:hypothetical protein
MHGLALPRGPVPRASPQGRTGVRKEGRMSTEGVATPVLTLGGTDNFAALDSCAREQERRIDVLLACPGRFLGMLGNRWQMHFKQAEVQFPWWPDVADPEFRKNLRIFRRLVSDASALCCRVGCQSTSNSRLRSSSSVACRIVELEQRIQLPNNRWLTLEVLLECRFTLEQLLADIGDEVYVANRAAALYAEDEGTVVTWKQLFKEEDPPLIHGIDFANRDASGALAHSGAIERTRSMVAQLLSAKDSYDMPIRARRALKLRALALIVPVFLLAVGLLAYAIGRESVPVLLPAAGGMTGAALGMLFKLRDELKRGSQVREFLPFAMAQLIVGIAAGLFVSLVEASNLLNVVDNSAGVGAIAFVVGYSEAAFLGLIGNIAKPK